MPRFAQGRSFATSAPIITEDDMTIQFQAQSPTDAWYVRLVTNSGVIATDPSVPYSTNNIYAYRIPVACTINTLLLITNAVAAVGETMQVVININGVASIASATCDSSNQVTIVSGLSVALSAGDLVSVQMFWNNPENLESFFGSVYLLKS